MKLALYAVPNPGEAAREYLFLWHAVRIDFEVREFEENRKKVAKGTCQQIQVCNGRIKMGR